MTGNDEEPQISRLRQLTAPAADRNKDTILLVLRPLLPMSGLVLEIASGTGQHVAHFASALPNLIWQPSDPDPEMRASIREWISRTGSTNIRHPLAIDVREEPWPVEAADALVCINMVHISPWPATLGLMRGAARILDRSGLIFLYGPYRRMGQHTAQTNEAFDAQLRAWNTAWGVRDLEAVEEAARLHEVRLEKVIDMPANNLALVLRRSAGL